MRRERRGISPQGGAWGWTDSLIPENAPDPELSFSRILDEACARLMEKKAELSIKKIRELEESLSGYARALDALLNGRLR